MAAITNPKIIGQPQTTLCLLLLYRYYTTYLKKPTLDQEKKDNGL